MAMLHSDGRTFDRLSPFLLIPRRCSNFGEKPCDMVSTASTILVPAGSTLVPNQSLLEGFDVVYASFGAQCNFKKIVSDPTRNSDSVGLVRIVHVIYFLELDKQNCH